MLRFIKGNLENIDGIEIYPIISLIIFFTFFLGLIFHIFKMKKNYIEEISNIPLDNGESKQTL